MTDIKHIQSYLDEKYPKNKGFFVFGSNVYKTNTIDSDIDLVVIDDQLSGSSVKAEYYDIQFISLSDFITQCQECDIKALEGLFGPFSLFKFETNTIKIDWNCLRSSISQKSSHSFVKAKKKFIDKEIKSGQKSLFHSLRILEFGIQLAKNKKIEDFTGGGHYLRDILQYDSWEELNKTYKPIYNKLHSEFKMISPKAI